MSSATLLAVGEWNLRIVCCGFVCFFITVLKLVTGEPCTYGSDPCICKTSRFELNLRPLMDSRHGDDLFAPGDVDYIYYIQPCNRPLTTSLPYCTAKTPDIVGCQVFQKSAETSYGLGERNKFDATLTPESYILENSYVDTDFIERMMLLNIKCGQQDTTFTYNGYSGAPPTPIVYNFTIVSRYVCGGGRESSHGGISVDSVMTII